MTVTNEVEKVYQGVEADIAAALHKAGVVKTEAISDVKKVVAEFTDSMWAPLHVLVVAGIFFALGFACRWIH